MEDIEQLEDEIKVQEHSLYERLKPLRMEEINIINKKVWIRENTLTILFNNFV